MADLREIAVKWQEKWEKARIFEADANPKKKKFFAHFTYPYVNAYPHVGHFYTLMQADIMARYKRLQGFNVMLPQGWHATGSPIISAAERVGEREPKQLRIMASMGITKEEELKKFENPEHWVDFFAPEFKKDFQAVGTSTDWRRSYITTSLNPYYDKFIKWQFRKLKEKNYVIKGRFPVVWCPKDNMPVGDHDRTEGEGETPKEFIWAKFRLKNSDLIILVGTTRPDALWGQTHLWVDPDATYMIVKVKDEKWVVGKEAIGKWAKGPLVDYELYIVPAWFIDANVGSGIVYSALEDPVDLAEMQHIQSHPEIVKKYGIDQKVIDKLKPISIISVPGMGDNLGQEMIDKYKIKSPQDKEKLEEAKGELNRIVFRKGVMKKNCGKYAGMPVPEAQLALNKDLTEANDAVMFYELSGKIVCRCLAECTVKIVSDQWFIAYGNKEWKELAHSALDKLKLYPEIPRQQLNNAIDWLRDWACTREKGLGTRLPWDEKWLIESLSDSTIYFAFYPIAHLIQKTDQNLIDGNVFDYVMLGKGKKPDISNIDKMRQEFEYWYPFDFNTSGKDLIQNHIAFSLFNHSAIFPKEKWPNGLRINGWLTINDEKMSKSAGNIILLREMIKVYSPDAARLTIAYSGEGMSDPNWDGEFADSSMARLSQLHDFCVDKYNKGANKQDYAEKLLESQINSIIKSATNFMEDAMFRSALQTGYFEMQRVMRQYLKLCKNNPNKKLMNKAIESQLLMLAPFTPFICEEIWNRIGKKGFISVAEWPKYDESSIDKKMIYMEEVIENARKDIYAILKLSKIEKPKKIRLFVSEKWKYNFMENMKKELEKTKDIGHIIKNLMQTELKKYGAEISRLAPQLAKNSSRIPMFVLDQKTELKLMREAVELYKEEIKCDFDVLSAENSKEPKAKQALPGKAAILAE
ncbi:leucine--tRNA ligase [Candidatus Woesearchaeota archaeon]|nr:leucine--tRNA ligase [Candidatus Woesearchaeota archaeon]